MIYDGGFCGDTKNYVNTDESIFIKLDLLYRSRNPADNCCYIYASI